MARTWLVDGVGIARKVKHASQPSACQIKDGGATRECSRCHYHIDNSDVPNEWPGLPAGVKFDPSDLELVEHLAAKCGTGNSQPHMFIDVFIPTLEGEKGICYTHPENLPGAKKDGSSVHFFHITKNAYATGNRKRRKIHYAQSSTEEQVRWHKTGKTKPVMDNGVQVGCKKIMVLYKSSTKGSKPGKANWVMHQYHLGTAEDEKEDDLVVSKVFYQQQKPYDKDDDGLLNAKSDMIAQQCSPKTPKIITPHPPRPGTSSLDDDDNEVADDVLHPSSIQLSPESSQVFPSAIQSGGTENSAWLAGESQAMDFPVLDDIDESLLCKEILDSYAPFDDPGPSHVSFSDPVRNSNNVTGENTAGYGLADLENLDFDTPPDFQFMDLQFGSQDSIFGL